MASGLPIISSDAAGAADDLIIDGKNGFVYPSGNIERLSHLIELMLGNDELREKMGKESLGIINEFTSKKSANGFFMAADAILNGRNRFS